jgi:hypothetical protein
MILVMSRSTSQGARAGIATAAGVSIGLVGHTILATLGWARSANVGITLYRSQAGQRGIPYLSRYWPAAYQERRIRLASGCGGLGFKPAFEYRTRRHNQDCKDSQKQIRTNSGKFACWSSRSPYPPTDDCEALLNSRSHGKMQSHTARVASNA